MHTLCSVALAFVVLFFASCNCTKLPDDPDKLLRIEHMDPMCAQVEGGFVRLWGQNLDKITGIELVKGASRESISNVSIVANSEAKPNTEATLALPAIDAGDAGAHTLEFTWKYTIEYKEECKESTNDYRMETLDFEYVDSPNPRIRDGDSTCSNPATPVDETPKPNPETCSGDWCGGYERIIRGVNLFSDPTEKPTIIWNGVELDPSRITEFGNADARDFIKIIVPEGPEGVWIDFTIIVPPLDCPPISNTGEFFYEQGPCEIEEPPIVDGFDHYDAGAGNKLVAIGDVVDDSVDSVPDNNDVVLVESDIDSFIRTYKGDGLGELELHSISTLPSTVGTPAAFALGNFDGDAFADAAIALIEPNEILLVFNEGLGMYVTTSTVLSLPLPAQPTDVAVGDFDNDGDDDLAIVCSDSDGTMETFVAFFRNDGPKSLTSEPWARFTAPLAIESAPYLATADLDGSGGADLVLSAGSADVRTYVSSSSGATDPLVLRDSLAGPSSEFVEGLDSYLGQVLLLSFDPFAGTAVVTQFPLSVSDPTASTDLPLGFPSPTALGVGNLDGDATKLGYAVAHAAGQVEVYKDAGVSTLREVTDFFVFDMAVGVLDETTPADIVLAGATGTDEIVVIKNDF